MDFTLSDDRRMLAETLSRFLDAEYDLAHRDRVAHTAPYHDPQKWAALADLGMIGALARPDQGGFGGTGADIAVVFETIGRGLCPEPFLPALLALRCIEDTDPVLSGPVLEGRALMALATSEAEAPYALDDITTMARADGDTHRLSGQKTMVYGGQIADRILIPARLDGTIALFDITASDAEIRPMGLIDGGGAADILLDECPGRLLDPDARPRITGAIEAGLIALAAEAVGIMDRLQDMTRLYLRTRQQFGTALAGFQALQHRMVDLAIDIEQARSLTIRAASALDTDQSARYAAMAKTLIGRVGKLVAEEAIQLHGGIAMTWEAPVSHYAKRLVMIDHQLGDMDTHLEQLTKTL